VLTQIGDRFPAYACALGKALLAFLPAKSLDQYLAKTELRRITSKTIHSQTALRAELKRTHERGYALDDEEALNGVRVLAAPIFDHSGGVVAAVSLGAPTSRLTKKRVGEFARYVIEAAESISASLGWMGRLHVRSAGTGRGTSHAPSVRKRVNSAVPASVAEPHANTIHARPGWGGH
jgi:DNA-binding IclR family transcriptional regulator